MTHLLDRLVPAVSLVVLNLSHYVHPLDNLHGDMTEGGYLYYRTSSQLTASLRKHWMARNA